MRSSSGVGKACWGSVSWNDNEAWAHLRLLSSTLSHTTPSKSSANTVLVVGCCVVVVLTGSAARRECIVFQKAACRGAAMEPRGRPNFVGLTAGR